MASCGGLAVGVVFTRGSVTRTAKEGTRNGWSRRRRGSWKCGRERRSRAAPSTCCVSWPSNDLEACCFSPAEWTAFSQAACPRGGSGRRRRRSGCQYDRCRLTRPPRLCSRRIFSWFRFLLASLPHFTNFPSRAVRSRARHGSWAGLDWSTRRPAWGQQSAVARC